MSILVALVARMDYDRDIIAQSPAPRSSPSLDQSVQFVQTKILSKVAEENHKRMLTWRDMEYHYKVSGDYIYFVIAKSDAGKRVVWSLIDAIENHVLSKGERNLSKFLDGELVKYNDPSNDKIRQIKKRVDEVKDVMIDNIDKLLERGERLEDLVSKTDQLSQDASDYRRKTRAVKNRMMMRNIIIIAAIVIVVLIVLLIIILIACKFPTFERCIAKKK